MKNNSGFSLVELIVVIAIMAILAGVAVPTYSKYIAKANDAKVMAELDAVKTAAYGTAVSMGGELTAIVVKPDRSIDITVTGTTATNENTIFYDFYDGTMKYMDGNEEKTKNAFAAEFPDNSTYKTGAHWNATDGWQPGIN